MASIPISQNHRGTLETTFWMLDQLLCEIKRWAQRQEHVSLLYQEINTFSDDQCQLLCKEIEVLHQELKSLQDDLALKPHQQPLGQALNASCLLFKTDALMPLNGANLKNYGKVSAELMAYLEPKVNAIKHSLERMASIGQQSMLHFSLNREEKPHEPS